ncbi:uncharacterized protein METZ01_LOCUS199709, partial [marine metagenome]
MKVYNKQYFLYLKPNMNVRIPEAHRVIDYF